MSADRIRGLPIRPRHFPLLALALAFAAFAGGCAVGPDYKRPDVVTPPSWGWKVAEPRDDAVKGDWWALFHDPVLNRLEAQAASANQLVKAAVARVDEARAVARISESRFSPQASFDPSLQRLHTQLNHVPSELTATNTALPLDFSYEIDLWGKLRRAFEGARAEADASFADYCQVLLTLHADVAMDYFLLREREAQNEIFQRTLQLRQTAVDIAEQRFQAGVAPEFEFDSARTELFQARTTVLEIQRQRAALQDAIALLCGQPAPSFHIDAGAFAKNIPAIPAGLPSELLERRPDVAEAERKMAAANAKIGVAKAAFYPALTLTGDAGYSSFHADTLLAWQSHLFQVGPGVTLPILNGGRLGAGVKEAAANYQAVCAAYRQQVLTAFQQVSDSLIDLRSYALQSASEAEAVASANRRSKASLESYKQGLVPYLDVLDSQRTELQTELQAAQILGLRWVSTIRLIKALGGGYQQASAPASVPKARQPHVYPSSRHPESVPQKS